MNTTTLETAKPIRRSTLRLAGAAVGVLLILLLAPATHWMLVSQLKLVLPVHGADAPLVGLGMIRSPAEVSYVDRVEREIVSGNPNDLPLQIAGATMIRPATSDVRSSAKVARLRALAGRFSGRPELFANILRFATQGEVMVHRVEEGLLSGDPARYGATSKPCDPDALVAFDRDAAMGERLDSDNGYFPFMRAIGLFNARRDNEALAAVHRAAEKPAWREYYDEELKGEWRLQELAFGNRSAILHTITAAALLFPHYAGLRAVTRMEVCHAVEAEQAGRTEEGLAIRKDVLACGRNMRTQAASLIGVLVGIALEHIAVARPGGEPALIQDGSKVSTEERCQHFDAYLQHIGRTEEAEPFRSELLTGDRVTGLVQPNRDDLWPFAVLPRLAALWTADLLMLSNALWLLALGGIAALLLRKGRLQAGLPLPVWMRWIIPTGLATGLLIAPIVMGWELWPSYGSAACLSAIVLALPALLIPAGGLADRVRRLGVYAGSIAVSCSLIGFCLWQTRDVLACAAMLRDLEGDGAAGWAVVLAVCASPLIPVLILIVAAVASKFCRVPLSVGMVRAMRGLAVPVASVLMLTYGLLLLPTLRAEAQLQYAMERTMQSEGRYLADLVGKTWPNVTQR